MSFLRRGAWTLVRVRGIPVRVHWTLLLILPYLAVVFALRLESLARLSDVEPGRLAVPAVVWGLLVAVGLFASVLVHELAHTFVALRSGGAVKDITLMLLGGVSQVERMPRSPGREALMAAAGPITSLALGGLLLAVALVPLPPDLHLGVWYLARLNLVLAVFNLLPAFPLDGGRVLRGLLATRLGAARATRVAAAVGRVIAVGLGLLGVWGGSVVLVLIAVFVYTGAGYEARGEALREALGRLRVAAVMSPPPPVIAADETMAAAVDRMRATARLDLVVVGPRGEPLGLVLAADLIDVPAPAREERTVGELVVEADRRGSPRGLTVPVDAPATEALERAGSSGAEHLIAVDEAGRLAGIVGRQELERAVVLGALSPEPPRAPMRPRQA